MWQRVLLMVLLLAATQVSASGSSDADPDGIKYFELYPNLVTNYQREDGKIGFLSIGIQLKVKGSANVDLIKQHLPLMQDAVVWLLRGQNETTVKDLTQRETLRQQTLAELQTRIEQETKRKDVIQDVLFTKYVWQ